MFKKIRNKIETKRQSKSFFWRILALIKDLLWQLWVWASNSLKKILYTRKFRQAFKRVFNTLPLKSNSQAQTEIHSLVCHKHLYMYLLAIKSFLRFYDDVAVFVHSDGSLSNRDKKIIRSHVNSINIISQDDEDKIVGEALKNSPNSQSYRTAFKNGKQLFDFSIFSKTGKIIALDPDILFLKHPDAIIDWIKGTEKEILYLYEKNPNGQQAAFTQFGQGNQINFHAAFFCLFKDVVDIGFAEELLSKTKNRDWYTGERVYAMLVNNESDKYKVSHLNPSTYQSFIFSDKPDPVFRHYGTSFGLGEQYLEDASEVIDSLI